MTTQKLDNALIYPGTTDSGQIDVQAYECRDESRQDFGLWQWVARNSDRQRVAVSWQGIHVREQGESHVSLGEMGKAEQTPLVLPAPAC